MLTQPNSSPTITQHVIYVLIHPLTWEIRYVGYSSDYVNRYQSHLHPSQLKPNTHRNTWIKSLLVNELKPTLVVVACYGTAKDLPGAEKEWIAYYKSIGARLVNGTEGGDGGATMKGKALSIEHRKAISASKMGKPRSPETIAKMSAANKGKKLSPEHRAAISAGSKRQKPTPQQIAAIIASNKARVWTPQMRAKTSASIKNKTWKLIDGQRIVSDKNKPA